MTHETMFWALDDNWIPVPATLNQFGDYAARTRGGEDGGRFISRTYIRPNLRVSTVFLCLDHSMIGPVGAINPPPAVRNHGVRQRLLRGSIPGPGLHPRRGHRTARESRPSTHGREGSPRC